ncbi:MAG: DUF340 domain-containing protein [Schwartzia sp.]|nr:DUF340 domain-containing protein [Schwartzia sp. (in: firmicutes)]
MNMKMQDIIQVLIITGLISLCANFVPQIAKTGSLMEAFNKGTVEAIPGMLILIALAAVSMWLARVLPGGLPGAAYVVTLGCILTYPGMPGSAYISAATAKVGFLQLCTPLLAYAGIAIAKDLDVFAQSSWRILLVSAVVFVGTYLGSAIIAQVILKSIGII